MMERQHIKMEMSLLSLFSYTTFPPRQDFICNLNTEFSLTEMDPVFHNLGSHHKQAKLK
uniref:Uncharacterized protein n=1 Tax=Anguilla anguilla TaxID=7936 RepID=A0A0E9TYF8_ANGAN